MRPEADGSLRLRTRHVELHADKAYFDGQQDCLVWHAGGAGDHVLWNVEVPMAGAYVVYIQWTQVPEFADNPFAVVVGKMADTVPVGLLGAVADGQELQVIGEGF